MSIAGNLNTMELTELLQWLSQGAKTGRLEVNNGRIQKQIYFRAGRIYSSASSDPREYLGHFLVSHGFITELELVKAIEMQESNQMLLGKILVTIGAVAEPDLQRLLKLKAEESIYDLFAWAEGEFRFHDGDVPARNLIPIDLEVTAIILEGARRADEWRRIREVVRSMEGIPVQISDFITEGIDQGEQQILQLVDDDRTVEEICIQTHSSEYRTCSVLFQQYRQGSLKFVQPRWTRKAEDSPDQTATATAQAPAAPGKIDAQVLVDAAQTYLDDKNYDQALRHFRAGLSLEPDSSKTKRALERAEELIKEAVKADGVEMTSIPKLCISMDQITHLDISPQEGFILTRINGTYDLKSILRISPMQELDGLLVVRRLMQAGHVELSATP